MNIQGLQKLTLLDYPEKVACTIFTAGCNFRCPFCHNASLVTEIVPLNSIPEEEVFKFLHRRQGILDGVCVTGGEPLLQPDIEEFIKRIKELGYAVKLDTNGSNSALLRRLAEQDLLDYVAMDIKNAPDKYGETIGINEYNLENILQSVDFLMSGVVPYEFRTTVVRKLHKREDFAAIGRWIKGAEKYYLQGFVDSGDLIHPGLRGYTKEIMEQALEIVKKNIPNAKLRGIES
ncbi:anaerobic ribonucleoside-triphosphate reductase activating protein [Clostridium sp. C105KSO13]|uniref:anaerobic ribonucleoside-triphosphate reductase activating protein n=1 Tax=Clostridium sp. C105KSO13 TaxID=1776045 RepID=UPI0007407B32|nr:anaerobic ribonucleoside-triphosphate reductase activating protein [Clostridium sp. C105KSO13]CUX40834.1 molybdenum cofactor biosynthesis protein A [Clostridium sp. C105KSO13]